MPHYDNRVHRHAPRRDSPPACPSSRGPRRRSPMRAPNRHPSLRNDRPPRRVDNHPPVRGKPRWLCPAHRPGAQSAHHGAKQKKPWQTRHSESSPMLLTLTHPSPQGRYNTRGSLPACSTASCATRLSAITQKREPHRQANPCPMQPSPDPHKRGPPLSVPAPQKRWNIQLIRLAWPRVTRRSLRSCRLRRRRCRLHVKYVRARHLQIGRSAH